MTERLLRTWATLLPLATLGALASYLAGLGLAAAWQTGRGALVPMPAAAIVTMLWHLAWLGAAAQRRSVAFITLGWALVIESALLGLAYQLAPAASWVHRLAAWRRTRAQILAQIETATGLIPWARAVVTRLFFGQASATGSQFERFAAIVGDVDVLLERRLFHVVVPEELRQHLLATARDLATQAELAHLEVDLALEHRAMREAVAFRDRCEHLQHLREAERDAIARSGHELLLELATGRRGRSSAAAEGVDVNATTH